MVRLDTEAYFAVICHQVDGHSVLIYPNKFVNPVRFKQGVITVLPTEEQGFIVKILPPFGADIIQVVACDDWTSLQKVIQNVQAMAPTYRGIAIFSDLPGVDGPMPDASEPVVHWGEAHLTIHTYPGGQE